MDEHPAQNTDREIWNDRDDHGYGPSIFVTRAGAIGINVAGTVIVAPVQTWHKALNSRSAAVLSEVAPSVDEQSLCDRLCAIQGYLRHGGWFATEHEFGADGSSQPQGQTMARKFEVL